MEKFNRTKDSVDEDYRNVEDNDVVVHWGGKNDKMYSKNKG
jgi:hypothetical protein